MVFLRNDPLQQDWVEIARFRFRGLLFSASFFNLFIYLFFCAIFQLLVLAIFGAGTIFQPLVLAILAIFWRIRFWHFFQLLVLAIFGAGAIFQLLVLVIFGNYLEDLFLQHREGFCQN